VRFITANGHPDHDTVATVRRRCLREIEGLIVRVLELAREMGLLKLGTAADEARQVRWSPGRYPKVRVSAITGMPPSTVALESVSALHRIRFRTQAAFLKRARRSTPAPRQITSRIGLARDMGHPSPLVSYACPAASAEQVCSPVNIALHERARPVPKIEVQHEDTLSAHKALIGLHQQIVRLKAHRKEAALDHNVVVGETGQYRRHENAIA
jgi:hypothetical protein